MSKRIIISGGGTGGHIFPAVATAHALLKIMPDVKLLFVGANGKMEMEKIPQEGFEIKGIDIAGFNRSSLLKNIFLPFKILKSLFQAKKIIKEFKPDLCVGVGGYASFPLLKVAQQLNIKTLVEEQNSFAGKSNKILGKKANAICVAYDGMEQFFPKEKLIKTGIPVRKNIVESKVTKEEACLFFNFDINKKIVFAFGGSLGAKSINETLITQHKEFLNNDVQLIWQTGKNLFEAAKESVLGNETSIKVFDFIRQMEYAYVAADVVISRAGALSIAELCCVGKPVVFVPFPFASEDHQTHNAMALVKNNAALLIKDNEANEKLIPTIFSLLNNQNLRHEMTMALHKNAVKNADEIIANKIIDLIK